MGEYGLRGYVGMPSVYGPSNLRFLDQRDEAITVAQMRAEQFLKITDQVNMNIRRKRAVIVLFQDAKFLE